MISRTVDTTSLRHSTPERPGRKITKQRPCPLPPCRHSVHQTSDFAVDPASPPITHNLPPSANAAGSVRAENSPAAARCQLIPSTELHTSVLVNCDPLLLASPPITQIRPSYTTASAAS